MAAERSDSFWSAFNTVQAEIEHLHNWHYDWCVGEAQIYEQLHGLMMVWANHIKAHELGRFDG